MSNQPSRPIPFQARQARQQNPQAQVQTRGNGNPFAGAGYPPGTFGPNNPNSECVSPYDELIHRYGRGMYETGKENGNFNSATPLPTVAFEPLAAVILKQPGALMFLNAVFKEQTEAPVPLYILLFDLPPANIALVANAAIARITFGPIIPVLIGPAFVTGSGGTITYEAEAESNMICPTDTKREGTLGIPFNFGIIADCSTTPRILTARHDIMAITARFQT